MSDFGIGVLIGIFVGFSVGGVTGLVLASIRNSRPSHLPPQGGTR